MTRRRPFLMKSDDLYMGDYCVAGESVSCSTHTHTSTPIDCGGVTPEHPGATQENTYPTPGYTRRKKTCRQSSPPHSKTGFLASQSFQLRDGPHYTRSGWGPQMNSDDSLSSCDFHPLASSSQSFPLDLDHTHDWRNFTLSTSSGDNETISKDISAFCLHSAAAVSGMGNLHLPFYAGSKANVGTNQGEVGKKESDGHSEPKEGSMSKQRHGKNQVRVTKHRHEPEDDFSMLDVYIGMYKGAQAAWRKRKQRDDAIQLQNPPRTVESEIHSPVWLSARKPPSGESLKRLSSERKRVTKKSRKHPVNCDTSWFK